MSLFRSQPLPDRVRPGAPPHRTTPAWMPPQAPKTTHARPHLPVARHPDHRCRTERARVRAATNERRCRATAASASQARVALPGHALVPPTARWRPAQTTGSTPLPAPAGSRSAEHTSQLPSVMRISYALLFLKKTTHHILTAHRILLF